MSAGELSYKTFGIYACRFFEIEAELKEQYVYQNGEWVYVNTSGDSTNDEEINALLDSILGGAM
jgi:hypothetical protein